MRVRLATWTRLSARCSRRGGTSGAGKRLPIARMPLHMDSLGTQPLAMDLTLSPPRVAGLG